MIHESEVYRSLQKPSSNPRLGPSDFFGGEACIVNLDGPVAWAQKEAHELRAHKPPPETDEPLPELPFWTPFTPPGRCNPSLRGQESDFDSQGASIGVAHLPFQHFLLPPLIGVAHFHSAEVLPTSPETSGRPAGWSSAGRRLSVQSGGT